MYLFQTSAPSEAAQQAIAAQHLEESFTVHLGSQMKHTHNIRILTGRLIEMCRPIPADESDESHAQRLMLSISLYSQRLSAVVLLVVGRISRLAPLSPVIRT